MAIGFAFSSVLYLAPDFGTWKMDNSLKLASCTEDFLKFSICYVELALEFFFHTWESSTEFRTKFRTFLDKWTEFLASDAGKGILQYSGMGRYWNFPGATWNLETIRVWYTFFSRENLGSVGPKLFTSFTPCSVQFCTELHFRSLQP